MTCLTHRPNILEAVCCRVEVVKGALGVLLPSLVWISSSAKGSLCDKYSHMLFFSFFLASGKAILRGSIEENSAGSNQRYPQNDEKSDCCNKLAALPSIECKSTLRVCGLSPILA